MTLVFVLGVAMVLLAIVLVGSAFSSTSVEPAASPARWPCSRR